MTRTPFSLKEHCPACNRSKGSFMCELCARMTVAESPELKSIMDAILAPLREEADHHTPAGRP